MCGIIGINEKNTQLIKEASSSFAYRGPDAYADYADSYITLGHHRLSVIDTDHRSDQPFWDDKKEIGVVYNGEIYNFKELRDHLFKKYDFRTTSDTEVLVYAYREWGIKMTEHIQGMFALALYDSNLKRIFLIRDHRGIKPLYYYAKDDFFAFASEIKGITHMVRSKGINLEFNKDAIDLYVTFGYIPSPYTMYKDIHKLPKASYLEYDLRNNIIVSSGEYDISYKKITSVGDFQKLLEEKVLAHLAADVPIGVFFSGGTDSSLIAAILHKYNINLETFSIDISYKTDDAYYFKKISEHLDIKSHSYSFGTKEFDEVYKEVMDKIDEPTSDNSIFPTYFVSKKASEKVKVVLSGEGGDEFFYGYPRSLVLNKLSEGVDYRISFLDILFFITPSFTLKNHIFQKLFILFKKPVSYYLLHMSPARDQATLRGWIKAKKEFQKRNLKPLVFDQEFYLEDDLLRKTDLATSYASIEGRVPLLDVDIIRNAYHFESEKLEGGVLKAFLKKVLSGYLPKELVYRSKSGFGVNMTAFFKESAYLKSDLLKSIALFKERGISVKYMKNTDAFIEKYPNYCFSLICLYRAILNNEL